MSNQPSSRNYLQSEAVDFRSPVSESMLKTFAGTANWLLDKDTTNDATIAAIQAAASVLTGRVNSAVSFGVTKNEIILNSPYQSRIFTTTSREVSILVFRGDVSTGSQKFGITGTFPQVVFTSGSLQQNLAFMVPSGSINIYFDESTAGYYYRIFEIKLTFNLV